MDFIFLKTLKTRGDPVSPQMKVKKCVVIKTQDLYSELYVYRYPPITCSTLNPSEDTAEVKPS